MVFLAYISFIAYISFFKGGYYFFLQFRVMTFPSLSITATNPRVVGNGGRASSEATTFHTRDLTDAHDWLVSLHDSWERD